MDVPLQLLFIEDSRVDAAIIVTELKKAALDIAIERVDTPESFQSSLDRLTWDLIISDYRLPRFDAHSVLKILKDREIDTPVVVISGSVGEDIARETLEKGACAYLMKDDLYRLVPMIEKILAEKRENRHTHFYFDQVSIQKTTVSGIQSC